MCGSAYLVSLWLLLALQVKVASFEVKIFVVKITRYTVTIP